MSWTLTIGVTVAMALASLGRLGGVRFDADPGLCEPGDLLESVSTGSITAVDEEGRVARARGLPLPATCLREIGGLAPGLYVVRVTPPHAFLPPYSVFFQLRAGKWTSVSLRMPPVVVRGRITSNGQIVSGVVPAFVPVSGPDTIRQIVPSEGVFGTVASDEQGQYATVLWSPGDYTQSFRLEGQELSIAQRQVRFGSGVNTNDVDVGAGGLRIWFTERGATLQEEITVRLTLQTLPQKPFNRVARAGPAAVDIGMLGPGTYVVRATAERRTADGGVVSLVSAREVEVTVSANQATDVSIDLDSREGWLEVFDPDGRPIEGAAVVSYPGATSLRTGEDGRVSLATFPVGARVPIRTRTWGMTCHVVTEVLQQRVTIADAAESVVLRVPQGPANERPLAATAARQQLAGSFITGLAGASCPLPYEAFSIAEARTLGAVEFTLMLPAGSYKLTLRDGRTFDLRAPGLIQIRK